MKVKFSLVFNRKKVFNADGKASLWIRCRYKGKYKYITTKIFLKANEWDAKNQLVNSNNPNYKVLNVRLEKKIQFLEDLQTKHILQDKRFDLQSLNEVTDRDDAPSFIEFMQTELANERVNQLGTKKNHQNSINKFKKYAGNIQFSQLTYSLLKAYDDHLRDIGLGPNTIFKQFKNLRTYSFKAEKRELLNPKNNPFRDFKVHTQDTERAFLTIDELKKIEELKFEPEEYMLEKVRDMFIFSSYTSLRFSDVTRVNSDCLFKQNGRWYIDRLIMKKCSPGIKKIIYIPLYQLFCNPTGLSKPELLIEKYFQNNGEPLFAKLAEGNVNRYLKLIAERAEIDKRLSFHISRHTFGTLALNYYNISIDIVRRIMGHSKIETTQLYLHSSSKLIHQSLQFVDWQRVSSLQQDAVMY